MYWDSRSRGSSCEFAISEPKVSRLPDIGVLNTRTLLAPPWLWT